MKYCQLAIACALVLLTISCHGKEEEPVAVRPQYRISGIQSDISTQTFEYDAAGKATKMVDYFSESGYTSLHETTYLYPKEGNFIEIVSEETTTDEGIWYTEVIRHFEEKLFLSQNGIADHAIGNVVTRQNDKIIMMKNYTVDFHYNSSQQLTKIDIAEKRTDETGWEESNALKWVADLEWTDNNLTRYSEYTNPNNPIVTTLYTYFGGTEIDYKPILMFTFRPFYLPLQYQGLFGMQSVDLLKEMERIRFGATKGLVYRYSYDLSMSTSDSMVEGYSENQSEKETKYTVLWEKK